MPGGLALLWVLSILVFPHHIPDSFLHLHEPQEISISISIRGAARYECS